MPSLRPRKRANARCEGMALSFGIVEVVAEFGAFGFLAFDYGRFHDAVFFEVFAQLAEQLGIFGELLHENLAGAVEHGLGVGKSSVGVAMR
jgi:hypothetical protein